MLHQTRWQAALAGIGVLIIGTVLYLVSRQAFTERPARGGEYVEAIVGAPQTYNPLLARTDAELVLARLLFSGLTRPTAGGASVNPPIEGDLAERWEVSEDARTYTFHLRKGARWHDGQPVTADDVVFTIKLIQDPAIPDIQKSRLAGAWLKATVEKVDDLTVRVQLPEAYAPFLSAAMLSIVPAHLLADVPPDQLVQDRFSTFAPVGSGRFRLAPREGGAGTEDRLVRFDQHWANQGNQPYLDAVVLRYYETPEAAVGAVGRREVQGMGRVPPDALERLAADDRIRVVEALQSGFTAVYLNASDPLLRNASVREALSLALDRDGLIQARELLGGHGLKGLSPIPPGSWAHNDQLPAPVFDPQKAAGVLDEAGWVDGDGDEIRDRDGQPLHFTLSVRGDSPLLVDMAAAIPKGWRAIGIQVDIQEIQGSNLAATLGTRAFSALLFSIELPYYDPDPYALWHSTQIAAPGQNYAGFNSPEADQLLVDGRRAHPIQGQPERRKLYERFQEIFAEELPALIIAYPAYTYVVADPTIGNVQLPSLVVQPADRFLSLPDWYARTERVFRR